MGVLLCVRGQARRGGWVMHGLSPVLCADGAGMGGEGSGQNWAAGRTGLGQREAAWNWAAYGSPPSRFVCSISFSLPKLSIVEMNVGGE